MSSCHRKQSFVVLVVLQMFLLTHYQNMSALFLIMYLKQPVHQTDTELILDTVIL